jgi:hypothetical protein
MKRILVAFLLAAVALSAFGQSRNQSGTLIASQSSTATITGQDMSNTNYAGVHVIVDVTAITTGTLTPKIQGKDPASGKYYDLLIGAAIAGTGTTVLKVYPGILASGSVAAQDILPTTWRVVLTKSDASSWTYSVGYNAGY